MLNSKSENFDNAKIAPNQFFFAGGQFVTYKFSIIERKYYFSYFSGMLSFKADENETIIEIEETVLFPIPNTSHTVLELTFRDSSIIYEEEKYEITVIGLISSLGGFYSTVSGIFVLLFGTGAYQKWVCCWSYRRSFEKELASRYVSCAGIPFAEDPCRLRHARIENRIAALENLLKEYYIDANYLEKLRTTRRRYLDLQNLFDESERLLEDSNA
ncbi:hypothetical protein C1646_770753 [Rhizophagus diaphanus]|nr:hypothetical protein C1646_770753 [Rhizophagus diaphanus] [Rhizophagus sp. MUCL 43196]